MEPQGTQRTVEDARAEVESMTAEECLRCAQLARDVKPILKGVRQREIAEELAQGFEARAAAKSEGAHPS